MKNLIKIVLHERKLSKMIVSLLNIYPTKLNEFTMKTLVDDSFLKNLILILNKQLTWYYFFVYDSFQNVDTNKIQHLGTIWILQTRNPKFQRDFHYLHKLNRKCQGNLPGLIVNPVVRIMNRYLGFHHKVRWGSFLHWFVEV